MITDSRSTISYRSNLQPVDGTCLGDLNFLRTIRDPFALAILKKIANGYRFSAIQEEEYRKASLHCAYAIKDDYPWGTIRLDDGTELVVCKCINTKCTHFASCRPDFQETELFVIEENRVNANKAVSFFGVGAGRSEDYDDTDGDDIAAEALLKGEEQTRIPINKTNIKEEENISSHVRSECTPNSEPAAIPLLVKPTAGQINFTSFIDATQEEVITKETMERTIINAGPGTGKTWALIEKLIYMVETLNVDPEGILVLCFSRAAVEVIEQRLLAEADADRIGYDWRKIDIRTFDSFATYMIVWIQERYPDMLPRNYSLEGQDYDTRIRTAVYLLQQKKDIFDQYEHIIVDEVQDLVGCRAELVLQMLSILPDSCGFTLLGDACQALYDWQAINDSSVISSEEFYAELFIKFPEADYLSFKENHRQKDELSLVAIPYREAILSGSADDRAAVVKRIHSNISLSDVNLKHMSLAEAKKLRGCGSLGILTRTNGEALRISTWLKNAEISHVLQKPVTSSNLGSWIARILMAYPHQTINEDLFEHTFLEEYPEMDREMVRDYWQAIVSTQYGNQNHRYEIEELLKGLLTCARDKLLFTSIGTAEPIVVSNIHRAKGREFDTVLMLDETLAAMLDEKNDNIQEHKTCYVAITRPRKQLFRAQLPTQYIYIDKGANRRCFQAGGFSKRYLSHIEVGYGGDLEKNSFASSKKIQKFIQKELTPDTRLKLKKCPEDQALFVMYKVVLEENENVILAYTGKKFADSMKRAIQRIFGTTRNIAFKYYPNIFSDVYVDDLITCISVAGKLLPGARVYGDLGIWMGFTVSGFARIEKDRY